MKSLAQVLDLEMNPAPEPKLIEREHTNSDILKTVIEIYGKKKGGEKDDRFNR